MKNKNIYIYSIFWRLSAVFFTLFFLIFFIIFLFDSFDINTFAFFLLMILLCGFFSVYLRLIGIFIDFKKNLLVIRTFDVLGTLKVPLDKVASIVVTDRTNSRLCAIEFCVRLKNGYVEKREYGYVRGNIFLGPARGETIKKQVEAIFPLTEE